MASGMTVPHVVYVAFAHFKAMDEANAAVHVAVVRYSPLTFRLAELLDQWRHGLSDPQIEAVAKVMGDVGQYQEDPGR